MTDVNVLMNSPGLWIASSIMVIVVLLQSALFLRNAWKQAPNVGLTKEQCIQSLRSAMITAIGPSFSPVIILLSLIAIIGAPTTWMRMNDIGAARTELAIANLAAGLIGGELKPGSFSIEIFTVALWAMALNNVGWMVVSFLCTHRMAKALNYLNRKYNPIWIKLMMSSAMLGLFAFLTAGQIVGRPSPYIVATIASAVSMIVISKFLKNYPKLQEPALGVSLILGMLAATISAG